MTWKDEKEITPRTITYMHIVNELQFLHKIDAFDSSKNVFAISIVISQDHKTFTTKRFSTQ